MSRYVEIFWCPAHRDLKDFSWVEIAYQEPKHLYPLLRAKREGAHYLKCPALSENLKNSFVVTAPYDLNISFDKENNNISTDRYGQIFFDTFVNNRRNQAFPNNPFLFSLTINYLFYSHESVEMELKEVPLLTSESTKNIKLVPGKFNISKWLRPIEFAAEVIDSTQPVTLRTGDPIYTINFITKDNVPVKLTRIENTDKLHEKVTACLELKKIRPGLNLKQCYEAAENYLSLLIKK
jgi:hypothetical protein